MAVIRILSLNCFLVPYAPDKDTRLSLITNSLQKLNPELIALQEMFSKKARRKLVGAFTANGMKCFPENADSETGGLLFLSKLPVIKYRFYKFKKQASFFSPLTISDRLVGKGFQLLEISSETNPITFINTQLVAPYLKNKQESLLQGKQAEQIINIIKKNPEHKRIILAGDLNFPPTSEHYKNLVREGKLFNLKEIQKTATVKSDNLNQRHFFMRIARKLKLGMIDKKIDYTLLRGFPQKSITQKVVFKEPLSFKNKKYQISDHYAILTEIRAI